MVFVGDDQSIHSDPANNGIRVYRHVFDDTYTLGGCITPKRYELRTNLSWDLIWLRPVGKINPKGYDEQGRQVVFRTDDEAYRFINMYRKEITENKQNPLTGIM